MTDDELITWLENSLQFRSAIHPIDSDRLIALARIGASVMPRPIEKCGDGPIMIMGPDHNNILRQTVLFKNRHNEWHDDSGHVWLPKGEAVPLSALPKPNEVTT